MRGKTIMDPRASQAFMANMTARIPTRVRSPVKSWATLLVRTRLMASMSFVSRLMRSPWARESKNRRERVCMCPKSSPRSVRMARWDNRASRTPWTPWATEDRT